VTTSSINNKFTLLGKSDADLSLKLKESVTQMLLHTSG